MLGGAQISAFTDDACFECIYKLGHIPGGHENFGCNSVPMGNLVALSSFQEDNLASPRQCRTVNPTRMSLYLVHSNATLRLRSRGC